jgi:hypothetical protein
MPKRREAVSVFDASAGDILRLLDKWAKVRRGWLPAMPSRNAEWVIRAAMHPDMFLDSFFFPSHSAELRRVFTRFPDEAPALWVWARQQERRRWQTRVGIARAFRRFSPNDKAQTVAEKIAKAWGGKGWVRAVEEADREERVSGKRARKNPE